MSSQELEPKYHYRFTLEADKSGAGHSQEPSKAEVTAYIFEVLGIKQEEAAD